MDLCRSLFLPGQLSIDQIDLLCRANSESRRSVFHRDEQVLVDTALSSSFSDFTQALRYWVQCADDEVGANDPSRQKDSRYLSLAKTFDGTTDLRGCLDPLSGEIFASELEAIYQELFAADWNQAKGLLGDQVTVNDLERTPGQRRVDALVEMAKRSGSRPLGATAPRPLITIHAGYPKFSQICELASGTVISPSQVVPLLSDAEIETVVFQSPNRVTDIKHKRRFSGALKRVIEVRDRKCQHESGCDIRAENCQVDHILAYSRVVSPPRRTASVSAPNTISPKVTSTTSTPMTATTEKTSTATKLSGLTKTNGVKRRGGMKTWGRRGEWRGGRGCRNELGD
jgi:hypothetical protein